MQKRLHFAMNELLCISAMPIMRILHPVSYTHLSKTIYENIHVASEKASHSDVHKAASMASIHKDIEQFDEGYETMVGEKGVTLSGGQKQRVAIARCLLAKSPIIILDDSLSALDTQTDRMIQEALDDYQQELTMPVSYTHLDVYKRQVQ